MTKPIVAGRTPISTVLEVGKTYYFCTCGRSHKQPFCDSSHRDSEFSPKAFSVGESKFYYLCMCKKSANLPFCDGTHAKN
ncbi:MAG: CDGSH iron-sulfur domain-containing protein [Gammaproteobacteria bacterium]|nr:CDGSH iron-sulfur domain-containing protein [Gammaproteobacteria bacterium]